MTTSPAGKRAALHARKLKRLSQTAASAYRYTSWSGGFDGHTSSARSTQAPDLEAGPGRSAAVAAGCRYEVRNPRGIVSTILRACGVDVALGIDQAARPLKPSPPSSAAHSQREAHDLRHSSS